MKFEGFSIFTMSTFCRCQHVYCSTSFTLATSPRADKLWILFLSLVNSLHRFTKLVFKTMSSDKAVLPAYQEVDGFVIPGIFSVEAYKSALNYKPRDDDVFVVTYPKCGTTWVQNIVGNIYRRGKPFGTMAEFMMQAPFLEFLGAEAAETINRPGAIKLHLPFHLTPYNPKAKYIYITRNPKDCCVSFYYHTKNAPLYQFTDGDFDTYFELFIDGKVDFGDYFDHLLSWYEHRNDPNVLFITYEELKKETEKTVLKLAEFLDPKYKKAMLEDADYLAAVIKNSSFQFMKNHFNQGMDDIASISKEDLMKADLPKVMKDLFLSMPPPDPKQKTDFIRKGIIGDWRNHFSEEQNARLEAKYRERTKGTDILKLFDDYMT